MSAFYLYMTFKVASRPDTPLETHARNCLRLAPFRSPDSDWIPTARTEIVEY